MKSIRLVESISFIFALFTSMSGCGSDSGAVGASCASVCSKVTAAHCENDPDCMTQCAKAKEATPASCTASYNSLAKCFSTATFTCDDDQKSVAPDCSSQEEAWQTCIDKGGAGGAGAGGTGAGAVAGSGAAGSGAAAGSGGAKPSASCNGHKATTTCDTCLAKSCCDQLTACEMDAGCAELASCVEACADDGCVQSCADAATQEAVDAYNASLDCYQGKCASACSSDEPSTGGSPGAGGTNGGSGKSGIGAPNDGNTGFGSPTTPPDCLPVPSDVDGYCGDVKYKVIYDCPNGPPYDDCAYNTMESSGIYCCGH